MVGTRGWGVWSILVAGVAAWTIGEARAASEPSGPDPEVVPITLRVRVPSQTPAGATISIAGDFQDWNYDDPHAVLRRDPDGIPALVLELPVGTTVAFRFHRGDPATEEARPDGSRVGARRLRVQGPASFDLTVAAWLDDRAPARTLAGDVSEHSDPAVLGGRRLWVYLPPGYHDTTRAYPMLLMLDGQNVFDRTTSFAGEWEVDETCERAIAAGRIEPLVVVAVDNGQDRRMDEYTPWSDPVRGGGGGEAHLRRIVEEVLPWIRAHYRVEHAPERVGFAGSSLGGLMGLHVAATRADVFGRIASLSPSIPWAQERVLEGLRGTAPAPYMRMWVDMGTVEYGRARDEDGDGVDDLVGALRRAVAVLKEAGWGAQHLAVLEDEGARHHESAWAARFGRALEFLFPASP